MGHNTWCLFGLCRLLLLVHRLKVYFRQVNWRKTATLDQVSYIAAQIAMTAARDNPLSVMEAFQVMEHNVGMARKGLPRSPCPAPTGMCPVRWTGRCQEATSTMVPG